MAHNKQYKDVLRFKDIDITFDFNKLPQHDREYIKSMIQETTNNKSVKNSGLSFNSYYENAKNFALFNNKVEMDNWMSDFYSKYDNVTSHLLDGKIYHLAWTYYKESK